MYRTATAALIALLAITGPAAAQEIHKCKVHGVTIYTSQDCGDKVIEGTLVTPRQSSDAAANAARIEAETAAATVAVQQHVTEAAQTRQREAEALARAQEKAEAAARARRAEAQMERLIQAVQRQDPVVERAGLGYLTGKTPGPKGPTGRLAYQ